MVTAKSSKQCTLRKSVQQLARCQMDLFRLEKLLGGKPDRFCTFVYTDTEAVLQPETVKIAAQFHASAAIFRLQKTAKNRLFRGTH